MYKAEIIAIGDELLSGDVENTTTPFIIEEIRSLGYNLIRTTTVGDETGRIARAVQGALGAAEIVVLTGGLGPTPDDVTREALSKAIDRPLEFRPELWQEIQRLFEQRGKSTPPANINQAYLPYHAQAVPNSVGTACGIIVEHHEAAIIVLPGPPHELRRMWLDSVRPYLERRYPASSLDGQQSRVFKVYGIGESEVMERLRHFLDATRETGVGFGFYPRAGEVHIVIKAAGAEHETEALLDHLSVSLKNLLGTDLYGTGEDTLPARTGALLKERRHTVATAESCTGGLVAHYLTGVPGSSEYFRGGIIAYHSDIKEKLLCISKETVDKFGVVSEQTAMAMAIGARSALEADFGIATTGIAGPAGGTPELPVGTVFLGLATPDGQSASKILLPRMGRGLIKIMASKKAIDLLRRYLIEH
ncbi:MAG: competence/damage-inducible protein A [Thermacetogeniaceae bacterium]|jgi:nicotinamide-nucleotide amidase